MNPVLADPDVKINMSLDEIIRLTGETNSQAQGRNTRGMRKRTWNARKSGYVTSREHSVPLLSSSQGVGIYVSRSSPLLSYENRRRIAQFVHSRTLNAKLLKRSKEIIPAEYKLVKTNYGVERVLVPVAWHWANPGKKMKPPRKVKELSCTASCSKQPPTGPPPLITAHIHHPPSNHQPAWPPHEDIPTELDDSSDEVVMLKCESPKKHQLEVIDVESNLPVDVIETKKLFMGGSGLQQTAVKTLNDRFTMLTGHFAF